MKLDFIFQSMILFTCPSLSMCFSILNWIRKIWMWYECTLYILYIQLINKTDSDFVISRSRCCWKIVSYQQHGGIRGIVYKERMEVLYTIKEWRYCIQGEDGGIVYNKRMEVLYTRKGWRYCIQGEDGGIVYKERMEVLYTRRWWRYCTLQCRYNIFLKSIF